MALKPDVIVVEGTTAGRILQKETSSIPIVLAIAADPVGAGLVSSLTRPGRNITGMSSRSPELYVKQIELLKQLIPGIERIAVLYADTSSGHLGLKEVQAAAGSVRLELMPIRRAGELQSGLARAVSKRP